MKVAIVGAACRLPGGVSSLDALWELLAGGIDAVREIPLERFDVEAFVHPERSAPGRSCTFAAGVLDDIENFDFSFFGISKKEAEYMDPQQRLLLELAWEALEDAQIRPSSLAGSDTAVFVGSSSLDASMLRADDPCVIGPYSMIGNTLSLLANRISYLFDIHGPSLTIDTACSSSLVALHQACQALKSGESRMALVGGVHILCSPLPFVGFSKAHMLSASGRCKFFADDADGYTRAEGGVVVLLKPLSDAVADGDRILGTIAKTGINTDGRTIGIAYPNQQAQQCLMHRLYADPALDPRNVCYVEAHGTGTSAGDPVEARSIGEVFCELRPQGDPLLVGSIKSNLGHLEPASGLAGLLKTLLVLQKGAVPPNLHLDVINKDIDCEALRLRPVTQLTPLPPTPGLRLAGVSSFGFGGANAHIIVEQAPPQPEALPASPVLDRDNAIPLPPLLLSAHSTSSLQHLAGAYATLLEGADQKAYRAVASRTALRRDHLSHRLVLSAPDVDSLRHDLQAVADGQAADVHDPRRVEGEILGGRPRVAFVFSGNGGPWPGMGRALLTHDEAARAALNRVHASLSPLVGFDVRAALLGEPAAQDFSRIEVVQPLQFTLQICLTSALAAQGVVPDMTFGHSIGEVAAAQACGALSLEDACRVIAVRSVLQAETRGQGGMAVVQLSREDADRLPEIAEGTLAIAAINSSRYVTLSGPDIALESLAKTLRQRRLVCRRLKLDHPFHSAAMDPLCDRLLKRLADITPRNGESRFFSTVTGAELPGESLDAHYWWRNIRETVHFAAAADAALDAAGRILIELGPDSLLSSFLKTCRDDHPGTSAYLPTVRRDVQDPDLALNLWRQVHVLGGTVHLENFFSSLPGRVFLPPYPWDKEPCVVEPTAECLGLFRAKAPAHPLLGRRLRPDLWVWENVLDTDRLVFLADHRLDTDVVLPGAGAIEMALAAARELYGDEPVELENIEFLQPLPLPAGKPRLVRFSLEPGGDFRIESREQMHAGQLTFHFQGRIVPHPTLPAPVTAPDVDAFAGQPEDITSMYRLGREAGLGFGPAFRPLRAVWRRDAVALGELSLSPGADCDGMVLHPSLIDGVFQMLLSLVDWSEPCHSPEVYLPLRVGRFQLLAPGRPALGQAELLRKGERSLAARFRFFDAEGRELARTGVCRFIRFLTRDNAARQQHIHVMAAFPARHPQDVGPAPFPGLDVVAAAWPSVQGLRHAQRTRRITESNPFCTAFAISRLHRALCAIRPCGTAFTLAELVAEGSVASTRLPYLRYVLDLLAGMELARAEGASWVLTTGDLPPDYLLWREAVRDYPERADLLPVLSAWSDDLAHTLARDEAVLPGPNALSQARGDGRSTLAALLVKLVGRLDPATSLRILEIGAGSGQLARSVLDALPPGRVRYLAADAEEGRVEQLAATLAGRPGCAAVRFDPEIHDTLDETGFDCILAGYTGARFDDPSLALARLYDRLRPGGLLLLLDDAPLPLTSLVQGQDPGWWREEDDETEAVPVPRLPVAALWQTLLTEAGFADCRRLDGEDPDADGMLLVARKADEPTKASWTPANHRFVLLTDAEPSPAAAGLINRLTQVLERAGQPVCRVVTGEVFADADPARWTLDPEQPEHWAKFWDRLAAGPETDKPVECVHLIGFDTEVEPEMIRLDTVLGRRVVSASLLARTWLAAKMPAKLCLVTGGGVPLPGQVVRLALSQAGLVGFFRVCCNEVPGLAPRLVDLQPAADGVLPLEEGVRELLCPSRETENEPEIVLTPHGRFVSRLVPFDLLDRINGATQAGSLALELQGQGHLDDAVWRLAPDKRPGPGQVCIDNVATGVNYRDVMYALGRIPEEALEGGASGPRLGLECAGVVSAVGEGVSALVPGDRVCCLAGGCYDAQVLAPESTVFPLPDSLDFAAAATIPVAHFTAYYALTELGRLQPGEWILIHGGAGGVGLAAIQLAQHIGATIIATAGSSQKRQFLTALGVHHVLDSRSLAFEAQVRALTNGVGVDVVLNSIAGETLQKSLGLLRPLGRFLELGKVDFYANSPLRMRLLRENISFFAIDLDQVVRERPARCHQLFADMLTLFASRALTPLPHVAYPRLAVTEAWHAMRRSNHLGKLVVVREPLTPAVRAPQVGELPALRPEAAYLVTGGLGGLGLTVAKRLAKRGARHLVLVGRRGAVTDAAKACVAALAEQGVRVDVLAVDLSEPDQAAAALAPYLAGGKTPLVGIIHCAGSLRDATIVNLEPEDIRAVLRAKAVSAYNLHWLTRTLPLDFFVLFSSATTVIGNPGQANYVAANTTLEALAAARRAAGLAGVSFGWGPITDVGMLASRPEVLESLRRVTGATGLTSDSAMDFVEHYAAGPLPNLHVFRMQWRRLARLPYVASPVHACQAETSGENGAANHDDIRQILRDLPHKEGVTQVAGLLAQHFARILRLPPSRVRHDKPLGELGMDSLMYVELGLATDETLGVDIATLSLNKDMTILTLADRLLRRMAAESSGTLPSEAETVADVIRNQHGVNLSDVQARRLIEVEKPASENHS